MKELPPAAGNEWRHLYGATFTSLFLTRFCNGKRSAKISLRTSRSVWVDLRGGRKIEAGLRLEKRGAFVRGNPRVAERVSDVHPLRAARLTGDRHHH
ncbi:hypothetical protein [Candidatus Accumulibacter sp. ACC005]|uniref:hypothetical protein n=1 Tax=Candidatus Accumulibacter sp. ACC005 TaxID=2823331 RepID=UPI0025B9B3A8|nr:hypothetical protein [Candidatus Accumulibacter sp. ACC005]